jgi:hypothetical protein
MKSRFLLESFDDYVSKFINPMNEEKSTSMTEQQASDVIGKIILAQGRKAIYYDEVKYFFIQIFGQETFNLCNASNQSWEWAGEDEGIVNGKPTGEKSKEFFSKIIEFSKKIESSKISKSNNNFCSAAIMGLFYQFCSPEIRKKITLGFTDKANELLLTPEKILIQLEGLGKTSPGSFGLSPAILGYVDSSRAEGPKQTAPKSSIEYNLLDNKLAMNLFVTKTSKFNPQSEIQLRDKILKLFEKRKNGGKILEFRIQASTSRDELKSTKLSWGQLSFRRADLVVLIIKKILSDLKIPSGDPIREELNMISKLDIGGSNGDGTSGPNPKTNSGFYRRKNPNQGNDCIWIDKSKEPNVAHISQIDGFGNPVGVPTLKEMPVLSPISQYDKFNYINIYIKEEKVNKDEGQPGLSIPKVPANTISPKILLSRGTSKPEEKKGPKVSPAILKTEDYPSGGLVVEPLVKSMRKF